jgi:hypothetical protein
MEDNGIGVEITRWQASFYNADDSFRSTTEYTPAIFVDWFDDCGGTGTYIPGGGLRCADLRYRGGAAYQIITFYGQDDLGNAIEGSGRVDFNNPGARSLPDRTSK